MTNPSVPTYSKLHADQFKIGSSVISRYSSEHGWYGPGKRGEVSHLPWKNPSGKWIFRLKGERGTYECGNFIPVKKEMYSWPPFRGGEYVAPKDRLVLHGVCLAPDRTYTVIQTEIRYDNYPGVLRLQECPEVEWPASLFVAAEKPQGIAIKELKPGPSDFNFKDVHSTGGGYSIPPRPCTPNQFIPGTTMECISDVGDYHAETFYDQVFQPIHDNHVYIKVGERHTITREDGMYIEFLPWPNRWFWKAAFKAVTPAEVKAPANGPHNPTQQFHINFKDKTMASKYILTSNVEGINIQSIKTSEPDAIAEATHVIRKGAAEVTIWKAVKVVRPQANVMITDLE